MYTKRTSYFCFSTTEVPHISLDRGPYKKAPGRLL